MFDSPRACAAAAILASLVWYSAAAELAVAAPASSSDPSWTWRALVEEVRQANPTLQAAQRAMEGAEANIRARGAWPEPQILVEIAPLALGSDHGPGYAAQLSQRLPLGGKPGLDREIAGLQRAIAQEDSREVMLRLSEQAALLYHEYWLLSRTLEQLEIHRALLDNLAQSARARFEVQRAPEVAVIRAELEIARLEQETLGWITRRDAVAAALNGLRHQPVRAALPIPQGPPDPAPVGEVEADPPPRLQVAQAQVDAARLSAQRSRRNWTPEPMVMITYNTMWPQVPHRLMIGAGVDLPLAIGARKGAVDAAESEVLRREAQRLAVQDQVEVEAREAWLNVEAARQTHALVRDKVLPLAEERVRAAQAAFESDQADFGEVVEAERERLEARLALDQAVAAHHQWVARWAVASGQDGFFAADPTPTIEQRPR